jgi:uncharacterized protein YbcI
MSTDEPQVQPTDAESRTSTLMEISNVMVRLYKDMFGRGPTKVRSHWSGPDALTVILENTLTHAERNMIKMGEPQRLRDTRMFFQYASVREFCEPVEQITGRTIRSFISGIDSEVDGLSVETFVFYPRGAEGPSRTERAQP